jgi:hypothetical protein
VFGWRLLGMCNGCFLRRSVFPVDFDEANPAQHRQTRTKVPVALSVLTVAQRRGMGIATHFHMGALEQCKSVRSGRPDSPQNAGIRSDHAPSQTDALTGGLSNPGGNLDDRLAGDADYSAGRHPGGPDPAGRRASRPSKQVTTLSGCSRSAASASTLTTGRRLSPSPTPTKVTALSRISKPSDWVAVSAAVITTDAFPKGRIGPGGALGQFRRVLDLVLRQIDI